VDGERFVKPITIDNLIIPVKRTISSSLTNTQFISSNLSFIEVSGISNSVVYTSSNTLSISNLTVDNVKVIYGKITTLTTHEFHVLRIGSLI
jgi:hypothetical protein